LLYFKELQGRADYKQISAGISSPSYLVVYLAQQIALREYKSFNLYLKRCEDSAFFLQEYFLWNNYKINYALCRSEVRLRDFPVIKLTSGDRMFIPYFRQFGLIKSTSIMGHIYASWKQGQSKEQVSYAK